MHRGRLIIDEFDRSLPAFVSFGVACTLVLSVTLTATLQSPHLIVSSPKLFRRVYQDSGVNRSVTM